MKRKLTLADLAPALDLNGRRVNVDPDSRKIAVRVARYGENHSGFGPKVPVPRNANLNAAHVGTEDLEDGSSVRVAVLPMHTPHAPRDLQALHAAAWYENSGLGIARGRYTADDEGVRFDGVLFDDVTDAQMTRLTAGSFSGDWRGAVAIKKFSDYEHVPCDFVGACLVNIGGYSDTYTPGEAQRYALVASAAGDFISIEDANMKIQPGEEPTTTDATITAGGCSDGSCTTCDGSCGGEKAKQPGGPDDQPKVTLTASAVIDLVEMAKSAQGFSGSPLEAEVREVLVASGAIDPVAEQLARLDRLEKFAIDAVFDRAD